MTEMMTRFLALGFKLSDVIAMASTNAAKALNMDASMGSLREGRLADISVLSQESGKWVVKDCSGEELSTDQALSPWVTLREGEVFMPDWGPHPWGWLPEKAD
jgi:dihydroorotase